MGPTVAIMVALKPALQFAEQRIGIGHALSRVFASS
jgi:hypothetical protein